MTLVAADTGLIRLIRSHAVFEITSLIACSPIPVAVAARDSLFAQSPAPSIALSPILPGSLSETPPVEQAAAKFPSSSRARAPTVSEDLARKCWRISERVPDKYGTLLLFSLRNPSFQASTLVGTRRFDFASPQANASSLAAVPAMRT